MGEGGIVRDPAVHERVLAELISYVAENGMAPLDLCASPIKGTKGNREFFLSCEKSEDGVSSEVLDRLRGRAHCLAKGDGAA